MSDHHYCPFCGASEAFCGCPDDPNTRDRMRCPHCGGNWSRDHGDTSTKCLHKACGKEGSTVERPAKYAARLPDDQRELLEGAAQGELYRSSRSGSGAWKMRGATVKADADILRRWGYLKDTESEAPWISVVLTDAGRRLLEQMRTDGDDPGVDDEPFEPDENDPEGGWTL